MAMTPAERQRQHRKTQRERSLDWHAKYFARHGHWQSQATHVLPPAPPPPSATRPEAKVYMPPPGSIALSLLYRVHRLR